MRISQAALVLQAAIKAKLNILLVGPPGLGKTAIVRQVCNEIQHQCLISHPAIEDPTVPAGLPWPSEKDGEAKFLPFGTLAEAIRATSPTVWFLDDFGQADNAVQKAYMQLLHGKRAGEHTLSDHVTFIAATNRRQDRAGVMGLLEPVKSRFAIVINLEENLDDWCTWAYANKIRPEVIAALRWQPTLLLDFKPTGEMVQSPSPRTWEACSRVLDLGLPEDLLLDAVTGAIGPGAAAQFMSIVKLSKGLPHPKEILADPMSAKIPVDASAVYILGESLVAYSNESNFGAVMKYANRLYSEKDTNRNTRKEFYFVLLQSLVQKHNDVFKESPAFQEELNDDAKREFLVKVTSKELK